MKTILIVEDHVKSTELLVKIIEETGAEAEIKTAVNREEAMILSARYTIDLFMLDIMLNTDNPGDVSGMMFAEYIRTFPKYKYTPIIFTTGLEDPTLHAYRSLHCYYYVEKPYDIQKVGRIITEALEIPKISREPQSVFFRKDGILFRKAVSEVIYIENSRRGQLVHCSNGNLKLSYKPTKIILEELASERFIQCSRFAIVNKDYIEQVDTVNRYIQLRGLKEPIELGNAFKRRFLKELTEDT